MPFQHYGSSRSRFNASANTRRRTPRFALYKRPLQRIKQVTFDSNYYCTQSLFTTVPTFTFFGYADPGAPWPTSFHYNQFASAASGCLMCVDTKGLDIARYFPGQPQPQAGLLSSRLNDTIVSKKIQFSRRVYNYTMTPFIVRTLVLHNTGRLSPAFNFINNVEYTIGGVRSGRIGSAGQAGNNQMADTASQLFQTNTGFNSVGVAANPEDVRQAKFDYDSVDNRYDLLLDNVAIVHPSIEVLVPFKNDGLANLVAGVTPGTNVRDGGSNNRVDTFDLPFYRRLRYEDEGRTTGCVQGNLVVVHLVCPLREPVPAKVAAPAGAEITTDAGSVGEIAIEHSTTVSFCDGT